MTARTTEKPKPRLNNLNALFELNADGSKLPAKTAAAEVHDTVFKTVPFSLMDDFQGHPSYAPRKTGGTKSCPATTGNTAASRQGWTPLPLLSRTICPMRKPGSMSLRRT